MNQQTNGNYCLGFPCLRGLVCFGGYAGYTIDPVLHSLLTTSKVRALGLYTSAFALIVPYGSKP